MTIVHVEFTYIVLIKTGPKELKHHKEFSLYLMLVHVNVGRAFLK